jgi:hypothetical protein
MKGLFMIARSLAVGLFLWLSGFGLVAQQSLPDLVRDANADWMFGRWEAQTDNGTVSLNISWELDKHAVAFQVKTPDMEAKSYSVKDPSGEEVKYFGFDNRGAITKGSWAMEGDELVLRIETQIPDGGTQKAAVVFSGTPNEGLKVRMHRLDNSGEMVTPPRFELKMKKKG